MRRSDRSSASRPLAGTSAISSRQVSVPMSIPASLTEFASLMAVLQPRTNVVHVRFELLSGFFQLLHFSDKSSKIRIVQEPLGRLASFSQAHGSLPNIAMQVIKLPIQFADLKAKPQQFSLLQRSVSCLGSPETECCQPRFEIMLQPLQ